MQRKTQLLDYVCKTAEDREVYEPIIDEFLFLEGRLAELKQLPFIQIHPKDPAKQRATPAAKQYKELLQQYGNLLKILQKKAGIDDESGNESPLRKWVKSHVNQ